MLTNGWRPIIWTGILLLMVLSIVTPVGILTISFLMIPILVLYMTLELRSFIIYTAIGFGLIILMLGLLAFPLLLIFLFFLVPVIAMAHFYKKQANAHWAIIAGIITILGELILILLVTAMLGFNLISELTNVVMSSFQSLPPVLQQEMSAEFVQQTLQMTVQMVPFYMICFAVYYTLLTHWIGRHLLKQSEVHIEPLRPLKEWRLPRTLVWYYMGALLLNFVVGVESGTIITTILYNLVPLLTIAFCVQAIGFLFFLADVKKWNKTLPVAGIVASLFIPALISVVGVFDIMLDLRRNFQKQ